LRTTLGIHLDAAGDLGGAMRQYREAMRVEPAFVRPYSIVGDTYSMTVGRLDQAARFLRRAEKLDPDNQDVKFVLAFDYLSLDEERLFSEKVEDLRRLNAGLELLWVDAMRAYLDDRREHARAAILKVLAENPKDASAMSVLSAIRGTREQAKESLKVLLTSDPELPQAANPGSRAGDALICLLAQSGDHEQARALTQRWEPVWRSRQAFSWLSESARYSSLARSLSCTDRREDALSEIEALVNAGLNIGWRDMAMDPAYEAIRNNPRFRAVSDQLRAADAAAKARFRARPDLNDADIDSLGT
jgi:tetratricopeptide (TPR) repeat protein